VARPRTPRHKAPAKSKPTPARKTMRSRLTNPKLLITLGVVVAVAVVAFFPVALATDQSSFCKTCHTMQPFYDAWSVGRHAGHAQCIDCHVDAGYPARFLHKFVALREVVAQVKGGAGFPNYNADVPDARCLRCHPDAPTKVVGKFDHAQHNGVRCAKCHASTGHEVTFSALRSAGILNARNAPADQTYVGQTLSASAGKGSVYPGHRSVPCQSCHDQANLQCDYCHTPPPNHYGLDCRACHSNAAVPFSQFTHPKTHHDYRSRPCVKCHPVDYTHVYCTCHNGRPPRD
jgi:cytochrome c nitrite reductase small subunit